MIPQTVGPNSLPRKAYNFCINKICRCFGINIRSHQTTKLTMHKFDVVTFAQSFLPFDSTQNHTLWTESQFNARITVWAQLKFHGLKQSLAVWDRAKTVSHGLRPVQCRFSIFRLLYCAIHYRTFVVQKWIPVVMKVEWTIRAHSKNDWL